MKLSLTKGTTSKLVEIFILNSTSTAGAGLTGLAYNTSGLTAYYYREGAGSAVAISLATMTLGTWTSGGFVVVDGTNMPGVYQLGIPDAVLASGANSVLIMIKGAANMPPIPLEIELTATNNQDGVRGGLTALPNAAAAASGGLATLGAAIPNATAGASGGLPTVDSTNSVKLQTPAKRNTALSAFEFVMLDATTGAPKTGLTVSADRSIDGATPAGCANPVTEVTSGNGRYKIDLATGDMNGTVIGLRFYATGARDTFYTLLTMP